MEDDDQDKDDDDIEDAIDDINGMMMTDDDDVDDINGMMMTDDKVKPSPTVLIANLVAEWQLLLLQLLIKDNDDESVKVFKKAMMMKV